MPNTAAWVDTGFLVALFARDDEHFASVAEFLANAQRLELHSLWPVVAEACFFLDTPGKLSITHKSPSPLVGEGWGGGDASTTGPEFKEMQFSFTPHPNPPPQGGRGFLGF